MILINHEFLERLEIDKEEIEVAHKTVDYEHQIRQNDCDLHIYQSEDLYGEDRIAEFHKNTKKYQKQQTYSATNYLF